MSIPRGDGLVDVGVSSSAHLVNYKQLTVDLYIQAMFNQHLVVYN